MKDPAFLFYTSDFITGISDLTMEERGQYITLLCLQHQKGHLTEKTIRLNVANVSVDVLAKFEKDDLGLYYNGRLDIEIEKRSSFVDSRRENGLKGGRPKKPSAKPNGKPKKNLPEDVNVIENIIKYLNSKTGKSFKSESEKTKSLIKARLNDGFVLDDFKTVIDNKVKDWISNNDMNQYLRPETLFSNKFEGYLNSKPKTSFSKKPKMIG